MHYCNPEKLIKIKRITAILRRKKPFNAHCCISLFFKVTIFETSTFPMASSHSVSLIANGCPEITKGDKNIFILPNKKGK